MGDDPSMLRRAPDDQGRALIVFNALDQYDTRLRWAQQQSEQLAELGYASEELDLRDHFGSEPGVLAAVIANVDLVWVLGGNTFVLARAMHASGFAAAIAAPLAAGTLTYGGYSAGACVAGPDLRGIHLMDEPDALPEGYDASWPTPGLGLVDTRIVPHVDSDHQEAELAALAVTWLEAEGLPHLPLRDGQAYVIDGNRSSVA